MIYGPLPASLALGSSSDWIAATWDAALQRAAKVTLESKAADVYDAMEIRQGLDEPLTPRKVGQDVRITPAPRPAPPRPRGRLPQEIVGMIREANGLAARAKVRVAVPSVDGPKPTLTEARLAYRAMKQAQSRELGPVGREQDAEATNLRMADIVAHRAANPVAPLPVLVAGKRWCSYRRCYVNNRPSPFASSNRR